MQAEDQDDPTTGYGKIWYRIKSGNSIEKFAIKKVNRQTGIV